MVLFHIKMVQSCEQSPDPSNRPNDTLVSPDVTMILASSSDSEDEEISYDGYEVLPQEFVENGNFEQYDSQESSSDEADETDNCVLPSFDQSTKLEVTELWNSPNRLSDIVIDSTKEEQIKNAMAGFKLPSSAIPPWAAQIPEEEWKEQLKNRVALLNKVTAI